MVKIYIRLKNNGGYEGKDVLFPTTDRERAFTMTEEDKNANYYFGGYNQEVHVYEDEELVEVYDWRGDAVGFQLDEE